MSNTCRYCPTPRPCAASDGKECCITNDPLERFACPYAPAGKEIPCLWSTGEDCEVLPACAKDCPLNSLDDAAACEEAALSASGGV